MRNSYTALAEAYDALMYDVNADAWAAYLDVLLGGAPKGCLRRPAVQEHYSGLAGKKDTT